MSEEIWADIPGFESYYMISSLGRVKSLRRNIIKKNSALDSGYQKIELRKNNKGTTCLIHRLVAASFIPNPENKTQVNHIDLNKLNNAASNLEWSTPKENINHFYKNGDTEYTRRIQKEKMIVLGNKFRHLGIASLRELNIEKRKPVIQMTIEGEIVKEFNSMFAARKETGCNVVGVIHGKVNSSKGYKWRLK